MTENTDQAPEQRLKLSTVVLKKTLKGARSGIEFLGRHPFVTGLLALLGIFGLFLSILGYSLDRQDARSTTQQVSNVKNTVEKIYQKIESAERDWHVMDEAFYGVRVGGKIHPVYELEFERILRTGRGVNKTIVWRLPNTNTFSVTYNSEQDRIREIEIDWSGKIEGQMVGFADFRFGETTLKAVRNRFKSNGFSYAGKVMYTTADGFVTLNAFELRDTPTIIIVFKTFLSKHKKKEVDSRPIEKQKLGELGDDLVLIGISVADETFLDNKWGNVKLYDPKTNPIVLK